MFPGLEEQIRILTQLASRLEKLDALVAKIETTIERPHEHRDALISAAVTGKIDVRKEPHE